MATQRNKNLSKLYSAKTRSISNYCNALHDAVTDLYEAMMDDEDYDDIVEYIHDTLFDLTNDEEYE